MIDWLPILRRAIADDPRGITGVAECLGYSRPAVSRVLAGSYGDPSRLAAKVLATYARIDCPHLRASLAPDECAAYAGRSYGAITAADVPHWRACKKCPHNPANKEIRA
ncbi:hypothetical protein [Thauera aromatica]|uniref:hypothetical protein n=1 Tax=Thauera aromatica TaxID=59405 RepID=UPI001FFD0BB6|nr:hypothetical protein [Thauera aromatica]MCK2095664.1 hypothetical protein [Thauera aromatica]